MPTQVQFRRGTTTQNNNFTGAAGELSIDTTVKTLRIHDGSTSGGSELALANLSNTSAITGSSSTTLSNKTINLSSNTLLGTIAQFNTALSDADFATLAGVETLTNKTINGDNNTITNIANGSLKNSSITINGSSVSLGGTRTLVADDVSESVTPTNKYFTDTRARAACARACAVEAKPGELCDPCTPWLREAAFSRPDRSRSSTSPWPASSASG